MQAEMQEEIKLKAEMRNMHMVREFFKVMITSGEILLHLIKLQPKPYREFKFLAALFPESICSRIPRRFC